MGDHDCVRRAGLWILAAALAVGAQNNLSGRVADLDGRPLPGVRVELIGQRKVVETDADGRYAFSEREPFRGVFASISAPSISGSHRHRLAPGQSRFPGTARPPVDAQGRRQVSPHAKPDSENAAWPVPPLRPATGAPPVKPSSPAPDSLHFNLKGYEDRVLAIPRPDAGSPPEVRLKPGLAFEPYFIGSGIITDITNGDPVRISKENMYHVIFLGDGYTRRDIDDGRFAADVKKWFDDVFSIEPLNAFKQAFAVWTLPVASYHRTGQGATHFATGFGGGRENKAVTGRRIWELLNRHPFKPKHFDGGSSRNWVVQMAVLDPKTGRSGFSGYATSHANPANPRERVQTALAHTHHHEFFHSFGRLGDEYYDRVQSGAGSSKTSNLSGSNVCDRLPWKHLLHGGEFNPMQDSLVGAFGHPEKRRFHSELTCLMNGAHHNSDIFGGSDNLRVMDRLCNWCRELSIFRLYHGIGLLPGNAVRAFSLWEREYRRHFWRVFPFFVPKVVPQTNSRGKAWFMPCVETSS